MIAMITAVKSHGRMKSTRRMLLTTGLIAVEFKQQREGEADQQVEDRRSSR